MGTARAEVRGLAGDAALEGLGLVAQGEGDETSLGVAFVADPLVLLVVGSASVPALHWMLLPDGTSVTARADALRALRAMSAGAELTLTLGGSRAPALSLEGEAWELDDEWRLFEDLASLEEWSGLTLPMPSDLSAKAATDIAQGAAWARSARVRAEIRGPLELACPEPLKSAPDEFRVVKEFDVDVLGVRVPLGRGRARLALTGAQVRETPAGTVLTAQPGSSQATFWLTPPPGRRLPPVRTQATETPWEDRPAEALPATVNVVRGATRSMRDVLADRARVHVDGDGTATSLDEVRADRAL